VRPFWLNTNEAAWGESNDESYLSSRKKYQIWAIRQQFSFRTPFKTSNSIMRLKMLDSVFILWFFNSEPLLA